MAKTKKPTTTARTTNGMRCQKPEMIETEDWCCLLSVMTSLPCLNWLVIQTLPNRVLPATLSDNTLPGNFVYHTPKYYRE